MFIMREHSKNRSLNYFVQISVRMNLFGSGGKGHYCVIASSMFRLLPFFGFVPNGSVLTRSSNLQLWKRVFFNFSFAAYFYFRLFWKHAKDSCLFLQKISSK